MTFPLSELFPTSKKVLELETLKALISKVNLYSNNSELKCINEASNCINKNSKPENTIPCLKKALKKYTNNELSANIQLDVTNPNLPVFVLEIFDDTLFENIDINITNLNDYYCTKEGFIIRAVDDNCPELELKMILTNPDNDREWFRLRLIIRERKICSKCVKELINVTLIGEKLFEFPELLSK